jgi:hypothetical protein
MSNATSAEVRAAWAIFRDKPYLTRDQLNARLARSGVRETTLRMFGHFQNLIDAGFDRYIAINRFDVARASRPFENATTNPRYLFYDVEVPVTMIVTRATGVFEATGTAQRVGEVGAILSFSGVADLKGLKRSRVATNDFVQLRFETSDRLIVARVAEKESDDDLLLIEVEYSRLQAISEFTEVSELPEEHRRLLIKGDEPSDRAADLIGRRLYYTLEALEACRALANEALRPTTTAHDESIEMVAPPRIEQLRLINPLVIDIQAAGALGVILSAAWLVVAQGSKAYERVVNVRSTKKVDEARVRRTDAGTASIQVNTDAKRLVLGVVQQELGRPTTDPSERSMQLVNELFRFLERLQRQEVRELEVESPTSEEKIE